MRVFDSNIFSGVIAGITVFVTPKVFDFFHLRHSNFDVAAVLVVVLTAIVSIRMNRRKAKVQ